MKTFIMPEGSRVINFPVSSLGPNSTLDKYLQHCYLLGDPHLGRKFKTGVPVHRLGDREQAVKVDFQESLIGLKPGRKFHVCMGDLFDKFTVPNEWVEFAYQTYREAALKFPAVTFIVIQGNHDASKDKSKVSSFEIFAELCKPISNIKVLTEHPIFIPHDQLNFLFVPWTPFKTTSELLALEFPLLNKVKNSPFAAFGHWDTKSHGEDICENIIPHDHFTRDCCDGVVTGHYHKPERTMLKKIELFVTGSMQPYAHGEEADNVDNPMYVTDTKENVEAKLIEDETFYKNKVLRVLVEQDETPLAGIDCYALTHKKTSLLGEENDVDVEVDDFDIKGLFNSVMTEKGVSSELTQELWAKL